MDQIVSDATVRAYKEKVRESRMILYSVCELLRVASRLVKDEHGANEQAVKRMSEAIDKALRARELLK